MTLKEREIGDVTVLDLAGRLVLDEGDTMVRMRVNELIVANRVKIIANLHEVTYIDSCGLGVLVAKLVSVRNKGGDLRLLHLSPRTARVFAIRRRQASSSKASGARTSIASGLSRSVATTLSSSSRDASSSSILPSRSERPARSQATDAAMGAVGTSMRAGRLS